MANVQKFSKASASKIIGHCEREKSDTGFFLKYKTNSDIDPEKTELNMSLDLSDGLSARERLEKRLSEVYILNRKDVNVMCDWVITLPKEKLNDEEFLMPFFKESISFLANRYGEKNVVSAVVHMDEATPHLHYCFVPVIYDEKKEKEKVSAKEVISRKDLKTFHTDFENHLVKELDIEKGLVFSGVTEKQGGNKSIEQLKETLNQDILTLQAQQTAHLEQNRALEKQKKELEQSIKEISELKDLLEKDLMEFGPDIDPKSKEVRIAYARKIQSLKAEINELNQYQEDYSDLCHAVNNCSVEGATTAIVNSFNSKKEQYLENDMDIGR